MYINKAIIYGNLTKDPELAELTSGEKVVNFSIATNRAYKGKDGEKKESTDFHNIVAFGGKAETITKFMKTGSSIYVEGRLTTRSWDSNHGKQYRTEIVLEEFQFGPKPKMVGQEISEIPF